MYSFFGVITPFTKRQAETAIQQKTMQICELISVFCPNAMRGKFKLPFPGKASSRSTALPSGFPPMSAVFSYFHTTGCETYSYTTDGYGIFNVSIIRVRAVHTKRGQAQTSLHKSRFGGKETTVSHPAPPGDRTQEDLRIWILTL